MPHTPPSFATPSQSCAVASYRLNEGSASPPGSRSSTVLLPDLPAQPWRTSRARRQLLPVAPSPTKALAPHNLCSMIQPRPLSDNLAMVPARNAAMMPLPGSFSHGRASSSRD
ncbi:hypothetical protein KSP39_PZI010560 [Platanthera zijinensis]|uniref:Uncharacterized protein n=1 Tax=Platanthera zijinensis TaxID=2320716 RepID=A0AAP0BII3_9ASPA